MQELLSLYAGQKSKAEYIKSVEKQLFAQEKKLSKLGYSLNHIDGFVNSGQKVIQPGHFYPLQDFFGTRFIYWGLKGDWSKESFLGEEIFSEIKNTAIADFEKLPS